MSVLGPNGVTPVLGPSDGNLFAVSLCVDESHRLTCFESVLNAGLLLGDELLRPGLLSAYTRILSVDGNFELLVVVL